MSNNFYNQKVEVGALIANNIVQSPLLSVDKINANSSIVTQGSNISTAVTLSPTYGSGIIITQNATATTGANHTFTANHSAVSENSVILTNILGYAGTGTPHVRLNAVTTGSFNVVIANSNYGAALNNSLKIGYTIL